MANSLALAFPEQVEEIGLRPMLSTLNQLLPVQIACNDFCDIGLSARRQRARSTPIQYTPLLELERALSKRLDTCLNAILDSSENSNPIVDNFINECVLLSTNRNSAYSINKSAHYLNSDSCLPDTYLQIDSAIYQACTVGATMPDILTTSGFDLLKPCKNMGDLLTKYSFYTNHNVDLVSSEPRPTHRATILGLHALSMLLKINDDARGVDEDCLLGVPSYPLLAQHLSQTTGKDPQTLLADFQQYYYGLAARCGFSRTLTWATGMALNITSKIKSGLTQRNTPVAETDLVTSIVVGNGQDNSKLREQLNYSSILPELFRTLSPSLSV